MADEDLEPLVPTGQGSALSNAGGGAAPPNDRRAPRFSWTPAYEATFFRSLCDSVALGLRENSSFKAEAWERAAQALHDKHGAAPTKSHLINKSDNARKRFRLWRGLREDPDFVYDQVTKTVSASEDAWKAHIEVGLICYLDVVAPALCLDLPNLSHREPAPLFRFPSPLPPLPLQDAIRMSFGILTREPAGTPLESAARQAL
jgi:hypothetical protein